MIAKMGAPTDASVIVPAFNAAATIGEALISVLAQETGFAFEVIVIDDGSTDDTGGVARSFSPVRVIRQENAGPAAARNAGLGAAKGGIVLFLDADDRALPGRFDMQIRHLRENPSIALCFGNWTVEDEAGSYLARFGLAGAADRFREVGDALGRLLAVGCFVPTSTVAARRDLLLAHGGFPADRHYAEDYALWCALAAAGCRLSFIDRPLSWYRTRGTARLTRSSKPYAGFVQTMREALLRHGRLLGKEDFEHAYDRYRDGVDALLRHEWACCGRGQVLRRMEELRPMMPSGLERKYRAATLIPGALPRSARKLLHFIHA